jgi:hypothetical protein
MVDMAIRSIFAAPVLTAMLTLSAAAQEFTYNPGAWAVDLSQNLMRNQSIASLTTPRSGGRSLAASLTQPTPVAPANANFDSRYRSDPAVTRRVIADYLSFVRANAGEEAMRDLQRQLAQHNFVAAWSDAVRGEGLRPGNMEDALVAYMLLNWGMANNRMSDDVTTAAPAVRAQIRNAMAASASFASLSSADRQGFAETLMLNFVVQHAMIQHAMRTGDAGLQRRLGDAAQQRFMNEFGVNLRAMQITRQGFVARR